MNGAVRTIELNYNKASIDAALAGVQGFSWLYNWGMYLFLIATLGILVWIFFDSINKRKDQQALVPRIMAMVGFFLIIPAFIFRFTGNADGVSVQLIMKAEKGMPVYPGPVNWNVNWLLSGYGPTIAIICLLGVVLSIVAMVIYASTVQRSRVEIGGMGGTMFGRRMDSRMDELERKMNEVQRTPAPSAPLPVAPIAGGSSSTGSGSFNATIIDNKPQAATIIDLPKSGDTLTVQTGEGRGTIYDLPMSDVTVGRDPSGFVVLSDGKVSSKHLRLSYAGGAWTLLDLSSTNGTYLNGQRVSDKVQLSDGDSIKCGDTTLVFRQGR